jgi:hypothetical protein
MSLRTTQSITPAIVRIEFLTYRNSLLLKPLSSIPAPFKLTLNSATLKYTRSKLKLILRGLRTTGSRSGFDPRQGQRIFPLACVSRPALGPTQPPIQWVPGVLSPGVKRGRGVALTTHPHLVPRLKMSRSYTSSPPKRLHGV